ncbi:Uncharacterized protein HZ326_22619 [Fusarium oxysporum f. sp. albedinis]|nr:Uncharacterized protein HZ326_22619 [Fusarium oxysporum f. sp. albedinis]
MGSSLQSPTLHCRPHQISCPRTSSMLVNVSTRLKILALSLSNDEMKKSMIGEIGYRVTTSSSKVVI